MIRRLLPWLIVAVAVAAFAAALLRPDAVARRLGLGEAVAARQQARWEAEMRGHLRRLDATTPVGATVFVGASTVQGLNAAAVRACHANLGVGGETAARLADRIGGYRSIHSASAVVAMTGLNDVLRGEDAGIGGSFRRLLGAVPAGTPVILSSLPRLAPAVRDAERRAAAVARANALARAACADRPGCRFVDLHGAMSGHAALWDPDGIHLNSAGYALWSRLLREALAEAGVGEAPCQGAGGG